MSEFVVYTKCEDHVLQIDVTALSDSAGQILADTTESVGVKLENITAVSAGEAGTMQFRVDVGTWQRLPVGGGVSLAVDLSAQQIALRRATHAIDSILRATITGTPAGLYAQGKTVRVGGGKPILLPAEEK